jgi:excisionase family DNA binding protein
MNKETEVLTPVMPSEAEIQTIKHLETMLKKAHLKLVGIDGEEILLPNSIYQVLCQLIQMMASGKVISLVQIEDYLSSQEAADLLNISRPYLYTLLEQGQIPYIRVGTHRRIRLKDVMEYKHIRDKQCHKALDELTALSQEMGFYALVKDSVDSVE